MVVLERPSRLPHQLLPPKSIVCLATKELEIEDAYVGDGQSAKPKQIAMFVLFIAIIFLSSPSSSIQHLRCLELSTPIPSRTNSTPSPTLQPVHSAPQNSDRVTAIKSFVSPFIYRYPILIPRAAPCALQILHYRVGSHLYLILNISILYRHSATVLHILVLAMHLLHSVPDLRGVIPIVSHSSISYRYATASHRSSSVTCLVSLESTTHRDSGTERPRQRPRIVLSDAYIPLVAGATAREVNDPRGSWAGC